MRGTKAKEIRRDMQNRRMNTKARPDGYRRMSNGQIIADNNRDAYQKAKGR